MTSRLLFDVVCEEDEALNELCVVGAGLSLGAWSLDSAVALARVDGPSWTGVVEGVARGGVVQFTLFSRSKSTRSIRSFESTQLPLREIEIPADADEVTVRIDRVVFEVAPSPFLTSEAELQIGFGIRTKSPPVTIKGAAIAEATITAVVNVDDNRLVAMPRMQGFEGLNGAWEASHPLQLRARIPSDCLSHFSVVLHVQTPDGAEYVAAIGAAQITNSAGALTVLLLTAAQLHVAGTLTLSYLLALPFKHALNTLAQRNTFFPWAYTRQIRVGHRGSGTSQRKASGLPRSVYTENTLKSFRMASLRGHVDMVEFDVMLTKDNIPIIYHNWKTKVVTNRVGSRIEETLPIPIRELTLEELRKVRHEFSSEPRRRLARYIRSNMHYILEQAKATPSTASWKGSPLGWFEVIRTMASRIPTLKEVFESVPPHIGFNVEIKFPVNKSNKPDKDYFADRNQYVDRILSDILTYRGDRRVVISCFDPDVCALVRLKQPSMPVLFLTTAGAPVYGSYSDVRAMSVQAAIQHCRAAGLLGICSFSHPLLEEPKLVSEVKMQNLMLFTWGEDNNVAENVAKQRLVGVDGIIADIHATSL